MNQALVIDHEYVIAAYVVTWTLQLGYLAWLGVKWRAEKRAAERHSHKAR